MSTDIEVSTVSTARSSATLRPPRTTDPTATFEQLLGPVLAPAYATARHLTRDPSDAEDLVQEAALNACRGFHTFQRGTNFKAWFLRVLTTTFYMRYRKERRTAGTLSLDAAPDLFLYKKTSAAGMHEGDANPAGTFLGRLEAEQIRAAIGSLPVDFRVVAGLYFVDDLSYEDIAGVLGCPVGTVRSRLHRSRKMLQVALWRLAEDHGLV